MPHPGIARLTVTGELDYDSQPALIGATREMLAAQPDCRTVRLDCGGLSFCDSSGLAALLMVDRLVRSAGAALHLDDRSPEFDRLLRRTNLVAHFTGSAAENAQRHRDP
ncbi:MULTISPECIES: STAS domain-containing protein [Amycolatopsis]|uniref:STAS domain-containing protein n=1 Tax=Amycolatopsis sp. cg13 TaxID=3238807 RepID=UPI003524A058